MAMMSKAIYRFNAITIKLSMMFFIELEQIVLKFIWNHKRHRIAKPMMKENNIGGSITLSDFRQLCKTRVT